jgi:heat shock protein HslJ
MKKSHLIGLIVIVLIIVGFFVFNTDTTEEKLPILTTEHKNIEYLIDGKRTTLGTTIRYFGNELIADLNNDGRNDIVFLVTHEQGGSGTFFYVVAALTTDMGYVGSDGYLLGDRIAPQTTHMSQNPSHKNVVVVNYADRGPEEPMTTPPSFGKSAYLKLDVDSAQWGIVEPDFTGEADPNRMTLGMKTWVWMHALYNDGREIVPANPKSFTITFAPDGAFSVTTDCNNAGGAYAVSDNMITLTDIFSTLMYCEGSQEAEFLGLLRDTQAFHFTSKGELLLDLKYDSGTVVFQ